MELIRTLVYDQMGREVMVPEVPLRIVSIVPSQTELLYELGLSDEVVGITKFCIKPLNWHQEKEKVGGTKRLNLERIHALNPDLIIGNKEENEKTDILLLEKKYPVWMSDINSIQDAIEMIQMVGKLVGKSEVAKALKSEIQEKIRNFVPFGNGKILYLIWRNPYMAVGRLTFVHDMIEKCGFKNAVRDTRYITLSKAQIVDLNPEVVYLSSEPYPFKEVHIQEVRSLLPNAKIQLVDGEMFSWCGSRMKLAFSYFQSLK